MAQVSSSNDHDGGGIWAHVLHDLVQGTAGAGTGTGWGGGAGVALRMTNVTAGGAPGAAAPSPALHGKQGTQNQGRAMDGSRHGGSKHTRDPNTAAPPALLVTRPCPSLASAMALTVVLKQNSLRLRGRGGGGRRRALGAVAEVRLASECPVLLLDTQQRKAAPTALYASKWCTKERTPGAVGAGDCRQAKSGTGTRR